MKYKNNDIAPVIVSYLSRINKISKNKTIKSYDFNGVNVTRARALYDSVNYTQRKLVDAISKDLIYSAEFTMHSVLIYAVLYEYNEKEIWTFDDEDYIRIKNNFKTISSIFDKKSYIDTIKSVLTDIENGKIKIKDLTKIRSDGNSVLYNMLNAGNFSFAVCVKLQNLFSKTDFKNESPEHKKFRKTLKLIDSILNIKW
jgi:hypothetical protein